MLPWYSCDRALGISSSDFSTQGSRVPGAPLDATRGTSRVFLPWIVGSPPHKWGRRCLEAVVCVCSEGPPR